MKSTHLSAPISLAAASLLGEVEIAVTVFPIAFASRTCVALRCDHIYDRSTYPHLSESANPNDPDSFTAALYAPVTQWRVPEDNVNILNE